MQFHNVFHQDIVVHTKKISKSTLKNDKSDYFFIYKKINFFFIKNLKQTQPKS